MVEPLKSEVNSFAPAVLTDESGLQARVRSLTCLLHLGRIIESEDHLERVGSQIPDALIEGLSRGGLAGVALTLGSFGFTSARFGKSPYVYRKKILSRQSAVGEIEIHLSESGSLSPEQEDLLAAVAERLAHFYERKNLQQALEHSEHRYQRLFRQARDGIVLVDADTGIILDANESFLDMVGQALEGLQSCKIWDLVAPEHREPFQADIERIIADEERQWLALPIVVPTREKVELEVSCSILHFAEYNVLQFICRDITERLTLSNRLAESEGRYRAIFDSTPVAMISCDARGIVLDVNSCLMSRFYHDEVDRSQLVGRHVLELGLCDLGGRQVEFMQFLRGLCVSLRDIPIPETRFRPAGYANVRCTPLLDAHGKVAFGLVIIEDITEVREAQRAMIQSAKIAAVGQMTLGFAHEIGTPLGIISANAQYLLKDWVGKAGADELRIILSETNRITNLIQKLLIFSRPAMFHVSPACVNDLVCEVLSLMQNQEIMQGVEVKTDLAPDLPLLSLDPTLIKQVFFNLIINAGQAMTKGGRLSITSRLSRSQPGGRTRSPQVEIAFTDTGMGISHSNLRKIFTPFFTTKDVGKGTGLGLSVSYRIIQNHGGTIVAESRGEGRGATFRVYLPVEGPPDTANDTGGDWGEPAPADGGGTNGKR